MGWTAERVELLRQLWKEGLSASQIAGRLGEVTRNAVIGKVHRLRLARRSGAQYRSSSHGLPRGSRRVAAPKPRRVVLALSAEKPAAVRSPVVNPPQAVSVVIDLNRAPLGILDIAAGECRWPGSAAWCRAPAVGPYCDGHARVAYRPAGRRG